jgi:NAD-dependent SIR2 family protein deacetylase
MACGDVGPRDDFQRRLLAANREWADQMVVRTESGEVRSAPDGDADLPAALLEAFHVPACERCGGIIKPDVVFFGENVPAERVEQAWRLFSEAEVLLVVGSSLTVYSGRRFIYRAQQDGVPIAIVNIGPTRADEMAAAKIEGRLGEVLPRLADALVRPEG